MYSSSLRMTHLAAIALGSALSQLRDHVGGGPRGAPVTADPLLGLAVAGKTSPEHRNDGLFR
jgi:hypothetical protein